MEKIDKILLKKLAANLLFTMKEEEYDELEEDFKIIYKQLDLINEIKNIDKVKPLTFPFEIKSVGLREDEATTGLSIDEVLKNAKDKQLNQIKISKVVQ